MRGFLWVQNEARVIPLGGRIAVLLTSSLKGLYLTKQEKVVFWNYWIKNQSNWRPVVGTVIHPPAVSVLWTWQCRSLKIDCERERECVRECVHWIKSTVLKIFNMLRWISNYSFSYARAAAAERVFLKWAIPASFSFIFVFSNKHCNFYNK